MVSEAFTLRAVGCDMGRAWRACWLYGVGFLLQVFGFEIRYSVWMNWHVF